MSTITTNTAVITRKAAANLLLVLILASVLAGLILMGVETGIAVLATVIVAVLIKVDDYRIRRNRRR